MDGPADRDEWMRLVDGVLKGAPFDRLRSRTYDGLVIEPLYTAEDHTIIGELPGQPMFTRGRSALGPVDGEWAVRVVVDHADPAEANRRLLADLEGGATSMTLILNTSHVGHRYRRGGGPRPWRLRPTARRGPPRHGHDRPALRAGFRPGSDDARRRGDDAGLADHQRHGNLGADPLGTLGLAGDPAPDGLRTAFDEVARWVRRTAGQRHVRVVEVDTTSFADAGAPAAPALAPATPNGAAVLRALLERGIPLGDALDTVGFTLAVDADVFAGVAKFRAARRLWTHVAEAFGSDTDTSADHSAAPFSARTTRRMMTVRDPWVNILRGTAACFAAAVGGASSVTVDPLDHELGGGDDRWRRLARNTQLILQAESSIARVVDPAGGSYYLERFTDDLVTAAWERFVRIETAGGLASVLADGSLARQVGEVADRRADNVATRRDPVTGVTEFPDVHEQPLPTAEPPSSSADGGPFPLRRTATPFEAFRDAADRERRVGRGPRVFLADLGTVAQHTARATFAKNLFEAVGIEAVDGGPNDDDAHLVAAWRGAGTPLAVLCSSDALYAERARGAAAALKAAGVRWLGLAGRPGDDEDALRAAGVDEFVSTGIDVLDLARRCRRVIGEAP
ncbi:MAG: methylmalonyl-CoA mutase family protein [Microthrixaceae bacterium]